MAALTSTGLRGFDHLFDGLHPGDNVVFRLEDLEEYRLFCREAARQVQRQCAADVHTVYLRFADHEPILTPDECRELSVEIRSLPLDHGFEQFITTAHQHIVSLGEEALLLFDSLSDLSSHYYSDRMIGNFFQLTCPLVLRTGSVAYFALHRHLHSYHAVGPITETTQILVDVYRHDHQVYVMPVKTDGRNEEANFTLFRWHSEESFVSVTESAAIVPVLNTRPWPGLRSASYRMVGVWDRVFLEAEHPGPDGTPAEERRRKDRLLQLIISRDDVMRDLARRYLSTEELIAVWKRMVGTGFIGGKSVGMLLARAILRHQNPRWAALLEIHDSFFVASDVYYTFLVINNCWWERQRQKDTTTFLEGNEVVRERILHGVFPDYIMDRFRDMLDYYGTSPIIVRSSSLLEDNFGNAFAGKYESVFCTMQGNRQERLDEFLRAVRTIYASTISDEALQYRKDRGLLDQDEQMALLVQRVSGSPIASGSSGDGGHYRGRWFLPHLAGVAFSYNPYTWHQDIDPSAGLMRLVFGLGTRAVDRSDDDYTRVVALNAPDRRPESGSQDIRHHAQRRADVLDLQQGRLRSVYFMDLLRDAPNLPVDMVAVQDREMSRRRDIHPSAAWVLTFDPILRNTPFVTDMQEMLNTLRDAYGTDVDVEFTVNLRADQEYRINVVQCRPLQIKGVHHRSVELPEVPAERTIMRLSGGVIGHSRIIPVRRIVYVRPEGYAALKERDRHALAAVIRRITAVPRSETMLLGPGRWGTSTPSLGVPVTLGDIGTAQVLCEMDRLHNSLVADMSLGTHFFNEMVERDLLYLAYRGADTTSFLAEETLAGAHNHLRDYLADDTAAWESVVHVVEPKVEMILHVDSRGQQALLYTSPG